MSPSSRGGFPLLVLGASLAMLFAATACTQPGARVTVDPNATRGATEAILYSEKYDELNNQAAGVLVAQCMQQRGINFTLPSFQREASAGSVADLMFVGYSTSSESPLLDEKAPAEAAMGEATRMALWGDPQDIVQVALPNGQTPGLLTGCNNSCGITPPGGHR